MVLLLLLLLIRSPALGLRTSCRHCDARVDVRRLQEPLVETAEFVAEMKESDEVDFESNTDKVGSLLQLVLLRRYPVDIPAYGRCS